MQRLQKIINFALRFFSGSHSIILRTGERIWANPWLVSSITKVPYYILYTFACRSDSLKVARHSITFYYIPSQNANTGELRALASQLHINSFVLSRSTRQDADLALPRVRTEAGRRRLSTAQRYNPLLRELRGLSLSVFKRELGEHLALI